MPTYTAAFDMSARATHRWVSWLLPLIVLRAFVPAGFMLSWSGNDLQLVLCSGTGPLVLQSAPATGASAHDAHAHHMHQMEQGGAQHHHDGDGTSKAHDSLLCPFKAAGLSGVPLHDHSVADLILPSVELFDSFPEPKLRSASVQIDRIRGPPVA
ncbi:MAG: hypothetical protein ABW110_07660 [Steroidobacteraceae bacterium]